MVSVGFELGAVLELDSSTVVSIRKCRGMKTLGGTQPETLRGGVGINDDVGILLFIPLSYPDPTPPSLSRSTVSS